jgi:hypothetical protein
MSQPGPRLILPEGASYGGESLGTPVTALIFSVLDPESTTREGLVAPGVSSSNTGPHLQPSAFTRLKEFLRRLDAFRRQEVAV